SGSVTPAPRSSIDRAEIPRAAAHASEPRALTGAAALVPVLVVAGARLTTLIPSVAATGSSEAPSTWPVRTRPHARVSTASGAVQSSAVIAPASHSWSTQEAPLAVTVDVTSRAPKATLAAVATSRRLDDERAAIIVTPSSGRRR